ncbi:MAG: hypothetical protein WAU88_12265 [Candidatus Zixiibacteriota bacterium]
MPGAVTIYVDCQDCPDTYFDFFKSEIGFVNFVRDRHLADVHVLISRQETGSSGREWLLEFIGLDRFPGMTDTLKFVTPPNETDDATRSGLAKTIKMGLMRFVSKTPQAKDVRIGYDQPSQQAEVRDKWNYWVFNISSQANASGQEGYHYLSLNNSIEANRVTEALKIKTQIWSNYNEQKFTDDMYLTRGYGVYGAVAPSLTEHWSLGFQGEWYSSTYSNIDAGALAGPLIEFSVFPYKESSRRLVTFNYSINVRYYDYISRTIYDRENEWKMKHGVECYIETTQPWGTLNSSLSFSTFLHDFSKNRVSVSGSFSLNLVAGLQLTGDLYYSLLNDQIGLRAEGPTDQQSLLRQQEEATSYSYSGSFGLQYTFGSKYNNVVNRRFNW